MLLESRWLLIDDVRQIQGVDKTARSYDEGYHAIHHEGPWECIIFDHDLGDKHDPERTGYDLMCELERHPHLIPNNILIVTQNPVGYQKMESLKRRLLEMKDALATSLRR